MKSGGKTGKPVCLHLVCLRDLSKALGHIVRGSCASYFCSLI